MSFFSHMKKTPLLREIEPVSFRYSIDIDLRQCAHHYTTVVPADAVTLSNLPFLIHLKVKKCNS